MRRIFFGFLTLCLTIVLLVSLFSEVALASSACTSGNFSYECETDFSGDDFSSMQEYVHPSDKNVFISEIEAKESADVPCYLKVKFGSLNSQESYGETFNQCQGNSTGNLKTISTDGEPATGLQICLKNTGSGRMKGLKLITKEDEDHFERANCPNGGWKETVYCPDDFVANGLFINYTEDLKERGSITGIAMNCYELP